MCYLCRNKEQNGAKDIWLMREWYWKNRTMCIFRRGCQFSGKTWILLMNDINKNFIKELKQYIPVPAFEITVLLTTEIF